MLASLPTLVSVACTEVQLVCYSGGECVVRQGDIGTNLCVLVKGECEVSINLEVGGEKVALSTKQRCNYSPAGTLRDAKWDCAERGATKAPQGHCVVRSEIALSVVQL